jgi:hypothetical protein
MSFELRSTPKFEKLFRKLEREIQAKVLKQISSLTTDPFQGKSLRVAEREVLAQSWRLSSDLQGRRQCRSFACSRTPEEDIRDMINLIISSVSSINGFSGTVSLSAGNSYGATATFKPTSVTPPLNGTVTSRLTISTTSSTPAGTYTITITGTGGGQTHSCTYTLTVTEKSWLFIQSDVG